MLDPRAFKAFWKSEKGQRLYNIELGVGSVFGSANKTTKQANFEEK
jgi:hypothetical protein